MAVMLALTSTACAAAPARRPSEPLSAGQPTWPEEVVKEAERVDRVCGSREARLLSDYQEGKEEQQKFKTLIGSITGGVGTVGGAIGGVGAYAIHSPSTMKTLTGVTGIVSAGLGAVGTVVTIVVSPGKAKVEGATQSLASLDQKKAAAREALKKDPKAWSSADKEAWAKATKDLESTCR
jgi:hypothetical protein